jgi:hypothetical protein
MALILNAFTDCNTNDGVTDGLSETVGVSEPVRDEDGVLDEVALGMGDGEDDAPNDFDAVGVGVIEGVTDEDRVGLREDVEVRDTDTVAVVETVAVPETEGVTLML